MRILIIDDDPMITEFVRLGMREEGYAVDVAVTGADGRALAMTGEHDGIVLDVMLPDGNGVDIAQGLRKDGCVTPILMLTGKRDTQDVVRGLDAGADDYLTKPFSIEELKARVRALIRRGGAQRPEEVTFGSLELDRLEHQVRSQGTRMRLTPKEYSLLEYFILNSERVITRTELLEKVWDIHFDPDSNVVDVHVARLRKKLERVKASPRLATARGVGYLLTLEPAENDPGA